MLRHGGQDLRRSRPHARGRLAHPSRHLAQRLDHPVEIAAKRIQLGVVAGSKPHGEVTGARPLHEYLLLGDPRLHHSVRGPLGLDELFQLIRHRVESVGQSSRLVPRGDGYAAREVALGQRFGRSGQHAEPGGDASRHHPDHQERDRDPHQGNDHQHHPIGVEAGKDVVVRLPGTQQVDGRELVQLSSDIDRAQLQLEHREVRVYSRAGYDWTEQFSSIAASTGQLKADSAIIDGEAVVYGTGGVPDFQ